MTVLGISLRAAAKYIGTINFNTIYFNLKYFPFSTAIRLPVLLSSNVLLLCVKGKVLITGPIRPGMIKIGLDGVGIFDKYKSRSIWEVRGTVIFAGRANIGHGSKICVGKEGELSMGNNFVISAESSIVVARKVSFGNDCILSWDILVMDTDWHKIYGISDNPINPDKEIVVADRVWIGCRVMVLKGSVIAQDTVIAAGSIVAKKLNNSNTVYGDYPLRVLRDNVYWKP